MTSDRKIDILGLTAHIVSAYVENNKVPAAATKAVAAPAKTRGRAKKA